MAQTLDSQARFPTSASSTTTNAWSLGYTCTTGSVGVLVVFAIWSGTTGRTGGAPTYAGSPLTQASTQQGVTETGIEAWYLLNPASGSFTLTVPNNGGRDGWVYVASAKSSSGSVSFAYDSVGVNATTGSKPWTTITTVATPTIIFTGIGTGDNTWLPTTLSGTALYNDDNGTWGGGAQYTVKTAAAGATLVSWTDATSDDYGAIAVAFKEITRNFTLPPVANATQTMSSESVALTYHAPPATLVINDTQQTQVSDNVALSAHYILSSVKDATQAQTAENTMISFHNMLVVQDTTQTQTSENTILSAHYALITSDVTQLQNSDNVALSAHYILTNVQDATQAQTAENTTLTVYYSIITQDSAQIQTSESVVLNAHYSLTIQDSTQIQISDNVTITYNSSTVTLSVNDATQAQRVNFYTFTDGFGGDVDTACDTSVFLNDFPTCNFGITTGLYYLLNDRKSLLRFDLSDIPFDATCVNATLTLKDESTAPTATLVVYSISVNNKEWIEGTKTFATAGAGEPCWNALAADGAGGVTTAWHGSAGLSTSGEDFEADAIGTFSVNGEPALTPFICSLDTNRISGWFGENNTNYGILLLTSDYSGFNGDFSSSDAATTSYRPKLVVQYIIPLALTQNYSLTVQDATQTQSTITSGTFTDGYEGDVFSAFDTFIGEYVGGEKSTDGYLVAGQLVSDDVKQTLMKFTLTSLEGKAITNAILTLYDAGGGNNTNGTYHIHRILPANAGWLEIATWQYADGAGASQYWAGDVGHDFGNDATCRVSGTDYATEIMSSLDLTNPAFSTKRDYILDITEFDNMVNANHGICIHGYDVNSTSWVFVSSDMPGNEMYYPKLIVTYIIPLTLTQNYSLSVQDATQTQTSENIILGAHYSIIIQDVTELQTSENVVLSAHYSIVAQDVTQLQIAENIILGAHYSITINDAAQLQNSSDIILAAIYSLIMNNAFQTQTSDNVTLGVGTIGVPRQMMHYIRLRSR
jgi:hypothetical protein